jgi:hypothetical protein
VLCLRWHDVHVVPLHVSNLGDEGTLQHMPPSFYFLPNGAPAAAQVLSFDLSSSSTGAGEGVPGTASPSSAATPGGLTPSTGLTSSAIIRLGPCRTDCQAQVRGRR